MSYVNSMLKRHCYSDISPLFSKTNAPMKEVSESYGALHHMKNATSTDNLMMDDFLFLHIGDGSTARTGGMFTFMSKSANISIDPQTNLDYLSEWVEKFKVENFDVHKSTWQDYIPFYKDDKLSYGKKHLGIVLVHSHVRTIDVMNAFPEWKYIYVNPCCHPNEQFLSTKQIENNDIDVVIAGNDNNILSERKFIIVYKNRKWGV